MVRTVTDAIIDSGHVARGWLGIHIQPLNEDLAASFGLDHPNGVLVADVVPNGPSAAAGLEPGDVVTAIDGRTITDPSSLLNAVGTAAPGSVIEVEIARGGAQDTIDVTLGTRPGADEMADARRTEPARADDLGLAVGKLPRDLANRLGLDADGGVVVEAVQPGGAAAEGGLRPGDVIVQVGARPVRDPAAFWSAIAEEDPSDGVRLRIQRGQSKRFAVIKSPTK
jgi:serine protease Do